jgi:hypothetical protein
LFYEHNVLVPRSSNARRNLSNQQPVYIYDDLTGPLLNSHKAEIRTLLSGATDTPNEFEVIVPIYQTAIHLADNRPTFAGEESREAERHILTGEFEAALVQFDDEDLSHIGYILDLLGNREGITELARFSRGHPVSVQRFNATSLWPFFTGSAGQRADSHISFA